MFFLGPKCFSPALFNVQIFFKQKIHMSQHADGVNSGNVRWLGFQMWKCFLTEIRKRRTAILWRIILNSGSDLPLHKFVNHYFQSFLFCITLNFYFRHISYTLALWSLMRAQFILSSVPFHILALTHIGTMKLFAAISCRCKQTKELEGMFEWSLAKKCHWPITYFDQLVRPLKLFTTGSTWRGGRLGLPSIM